MEGREARYLFFLGLFCLFQSAGVVSFEIAFTVQYMCNLNYHSSCSCGGGGNQALVLGFRILLLGDEFVPIIL